MPDPTLFEYDVFISYSSRDRDWVQRNLLKEIEAVGLRAFIDFRDFKRGAPSIKEMERGVSNCRKTLVVLTPAYIESEWCEIETVMLQTLSPANRDLRLIPLLKSPCEKPLRIRALTHIDFTDEGDLDLAWHQLLSALETSPNVPGEDAIPPDVQEELDKAKSSVEGDKYAEAMPILEHALSLADDAGHSIARVKVRLSIARALHEGRDDFQGAEQHYRDALVLVPVGNRDLKQRVLQGLGEMLLAAGRIDEARAVVSEAADVAKQSGKKEELAWSLILQSHLQEVLGFHTGAFTMLDEAINLLFQSSLSLAGESKRENASALAICYLNKAVLCRHDGKSDEALAFCQNAEEQHRISGDKLDAGKALLLCGEIHCGNADWEKGFANFQRAIGLFLEISNPLWLARAAERISRLHATHEQWEEALKGMLAAAAGAAESDHAGEQVHFLCEAADLLRRWKTRLGKDKVLRELKKLAKNVPEDQQSDFYAAWAIRINETDEAIAKAVREDSDARDLLDQAKQIAERKRLHRHLANCLLDEAYQATEEDDAERRLELVGRAIELLKQELTGAQSPKARGELMGRISALYRGLGHNAEAMSWLHRARQVFEQSGDVQGLVHFYGSLGEMQRTEGRLEDEITSYRKALALLEGRSFHHLAAGVRISLASALRYRREFSEAQRLLTEAEAICQRHHFSEMISAIGSCRGKIERELQAAQAPTQTLAELLASLGQLLAYRPERAVMYLPFWYFAMQSELLAVLRSGPGLSLMVITNDIDSFMKLAVEFRHMADHFLMTTTVEPTVKIEPGVLAIPPTWLFPKTFTFVMMRRRDTEGQPTENNATEVEQDDGALPRVHFQGPANMLPLYIPVESPSDVPGEGHMMALSASSLPQQAIDLMVHRPIEELVAHRAVWMPLPRYKSKDPFLTDLRVGHERGLFPIYFQRLPTTDAATLCGAVDIAIPTTVMKGGSRSVADRWRRALVRLTKLPKHEAQLALLDLPEIFALDVTSEPRFVHIQVALFEFIEIDEHVRHPVIVFTSSDVDVLHADAAPRA